jgi:CheY-like chemotaxis protein
VRAGAATALPAGARPDPRLQGVRVLVAEDNRVNQVVAEAVLARAGCFVEIVEDGAQAVARALDGGFDAVLMDCEMPVMDGLEAARRIRAIDPSVPIIALTAHAMESARRACLDAGMTAFLSKPFSPAQLRQVLASHVAPAPR